jgi:mannose-1-phosphate guanylyltransferase/mannose-6-phosphate isomerase
LLADTSNTFIHASSRLVGTVGVSNLIVVETTDAVLVADRSQSQNVEKLVQQLEANKGEELSLHRKVHRPWGWYDSIDEAERFKVKRIQVKPGASLTLQKHHHRAEHWIVVKGTAEVTCGDKVNRVTEKASTFSRPNLYLMAPRPGLEPGTYGLTATESRKKHCKYNGLHRRKVSALRSVLKLLPRLRLVKDRSSI